MTIKLAVCYSSKNQVELTEQTFERLCATTAIKGADIIWCDGSTDFDALHYFENHKAAADYAEGSVHGGADAAIAWKLTKALRHEKTRYTHIMLIENDVLLDENWLLPTLELFEKGKDDGLEVGAVSPRSYVDRILFQRGEYGVMHNLGAGAVIFTRKAAELVLRTFRTGWWPSIRYGFAQLSGVDIATYAAFGGNEQPVTTDWQFEFQMLRHGLSALALTPAKCQMIGQNPPLAEQGLELTTGPVAACEDNEKFAYFAKTLKAIRKNEVDAEKIISTFHSRMGQTLFYPHQLGKLFSAEHGWKLRWTQGWGPFSYVAGPGGASLSVRVAGPCSFMLSGGEGVAANVTIVDQYSGFQTHPTLPEYTGNFSEVAVPGGPMPRTVALGISEGGILYGVSCADPQLLNTAYSFSWDKLPEV